jgi:hypothetical protein
VWRRLLLVDRDHDRLPPQLHLPRSHAALFGLGLCFSYLKDCYTIMRLGTTLASMSLEHERMSIEATHRMNSKSSSLDKGCASR